MKNKKLLLLLGACLVILLLGSSRIFRDKNNVRASKANVDIYQYIGKPLTIKDVDTKIKRGSSFSLFIYETSCPPCQREIREFKKVGKTHGLFSLNLEKEKTEEEDKYSQYKKLNIEYTPTILKFYKGRVINRKESYLNKKELENMHLSSFENNEGIKQFKKIKLKLFNSISKYQSFIMYIGRPTCPDCRSFENDFKLKLNKKSPHHLYYLNVEKLHQNQNRWSKFKKSNNIEGTPAFVYYKNGKLISSSSWTVKKGYSTRMAYKWLKKFY
ncbi:MULTISPECIES: thioredoxin family protein [Bacillota]|nr:MULTISPECIES: thioredoxin family protein [Bacillota]